MERVNYVMVQLTFAPCTFPNEELEDILLKEADKYIKSNQMPTVGVIYFSTAPKNLDYRLSACSNRKTPVKDSNGKYISLGGWDADQEQVFYRILTNKNAAVEFMKFNLAHGAKKARIITKEQRGVVAGVPLDLPFPSEERVQQYLWNQYESLNQWV